jgi:hypothetical protein
VQQIGSESVYWRDRTDVAVAWMKAFGVGAVVVPGAQSPEFWKVPRPKAFEGVLPVVWEESDTRIYEVPPRAASLARVVPIAATLKSTVRNEADVQPVLAFAAALDDPQMPPAEFQWLDRNHARVRATLGEGHGVSVAVSYHSGWRAWLGSVEIPVRTDGLGLIWLESSRLRGERVIELVYDGGLEGRLLPWCSVGVLVIGVVWWLRYPAWKLPVERGN